MKLPIRPGKVTCAGLVGIMLVLPSNIWKGSSADAKVRETVESSVLRSSSVRARNLNEANRAFRQRGDGPRAVPGRDRVRVCKGRSAGAGTHPHARSR